MASTTAIAVTAPTVIPSSAKVVHEFPSLTWVMKAAVAAARASPLGDIAFEAVTTLEHVHTTDEKPFFPNEWWIM
jgi:hypothetical protein